MSESNSHFDTVINVWRVNEEQTIELMKEFPNGIMHPNGIAYSIKMPTFQCEGIIKLVWFVQGEHQDRFRNLMSGDDRVEGHEILRRIEGEEE